MYVHRALLYGVQHQFSAMPLGAMLNSHAHSAMRRKIPF